ncbi:tripartite motif protein, putative [Plasmodium malariae]|uniref:Tripartite motif protein, putative n=1 Tax=Plasmodium malariae TaxID=5858 RepID=A0A1D3TE18_PLAMA|nr:tripartite motif protein, putative [Plasmodium malariae]SCP03192.1 tripartite motif protein, putative [Plasmodium malariae]
MNNMSSSNEVIKLKSEHSSDISEKCSEEFEEEGEEGSEKELCEVDNEQTYRCANCSREVEDVLILSCKHLICLICASIQLQKKYENFLKTCSKEKSVKKKVENYKIEECFVNPQNAKNERMNSSEIEMIFKKEKLGYITCFLCNIKNKLTLDTVELLTKVGLFSSDVLNVHTFYFNFLSNNEEQKNKIINEEDVKKLSVTFNDTLNIDVLKNENLKKLLVASSKYKYLDEHTDDLNRYSYICNICSFNEAKIYCKDCVEYLCEECCSSIHDNDVLNKLNCENRKIHNYYEIDKKGIHLKKIAKCPKKFLNVTGDDIEILTNMEEESFHENSAKKKYKVYDDDDYSDFDKYDEKHFYERKKMLIDKEGKKKNNLRISEKLNNLVEDLKNASSYDSENSSIMGTIGSSTGMGEYLKGTKKKEKIRKERLSDRCSGRRKKKKKTEKLFDKRSSIVQNEKRYDIQEETEKYGNVCLLSNSSVCRVDISSSDDSCLYSNNSSEREICITNVKANTLNNGANKIITDSSINNKNFTTIENIRCNQHYNYPIQYFCHTCCSKCFCSECAINGIHTTDCNIENINTAFITVLNNYLIQWNEIISDLINDLERNFYESLQDTKNDWSSILSECYYDLNSKISYINNNLRKKEKEIFEQFDLYMNNFKKENLEYIQLLNYKYEDIERTINIIRDNKFQNNPIDIIKFYRENIDVIDKTILLNNDFKPIEELSKIRESKIFYMNLYSSQIISYLRYLQNFLKPNNLVSSVS